MSAERENHSHVSNRTVDLTNVADRGRSRAFPAALVAAAIALASFVILHLKGIGLTPDGWAYWEGAISLDAGRGYTYFNGTRIVAWPPLYSLYLAAWSLALGPTALALIIANAVLVTVQTALWCWVVVSIWRESVDGVLPTGAVMAVAVYLGLFIPLNEQAVLADVLKYTLLPLLLIAGWRARNSVEAFSSVRWTTFSAATATTLLLVHNDSIAFIAANALALFSGVGKRLHRTLTAVVAGAVPTAIWIIVRRALEQNQSHAFGIGVGRYGALTYLLQLFRGAGSLIVPDRYGAPFWAAGAVAVLFGILIRRRQRDGAAALAFCGLFVGTSAVMTYVLFNALWVDDPLGGRFLLFIPLGIIPLLFLATAKMSRAVFVACVVIVLCPQFYWTATWFHLKMTSSPQELGYPTGFATPGARLSVDYQHGPPVPTEHGVILAPRSWEEQREPIK
jgi:hypothetical protein